MFFLLAPVALIACATQPKEDLVGCWRFVSGSESKHPVMSSVQLMSKLSALGYVTFYDGALTGFITQRGDTVNPLPYEVKNDTIITHSPGLDMPERFQFVTKDTLWLYDNDSVVLKFCRVSK